MLSALSRHPRAAQIWQWRAAQIWLRRPDRARSLLSPDCSDAAGLDGPSQALLAWLILGEEGDEKEAEAMARGALDQPGDTRFAAAVLAEVLLRRGEYDQAVEVIQAARSRLPGVAWYEITLADALLEAGRLDDAEEVLERAVNREQLRRHALKRLSRLALERGDRVRARSLFEALVDMAPDYLVYASDYVALGIIQLEDGDPEAARSTWRNGAAVYPRHGELQRLRSEHLGEDSPVAVPAVPPVAEQSLGVRRIPVRTPIISQRSGLIELIEPALAGVCQPGDVVALSESAVAAGQGRMLPLELVRPGRLAATLCRFVGEKGPLHSPEGMQGAVLEVGQLRVAAAAAAGAVGKVVGQKGWFYRVAGKSTAMIDDVGACLPPHDHHVIFGPRDPDALSTDLAATLGCPIAIVDANHRSGAWVVGASPGVDREWLALALSDNPAGNEDEQTPVVIVRRT
jgi:tetratricopeptide (TPR) repeat protein